MKERVKKPIHLTDHNVVELGRAGRIFDNTFDYTFN